LHTEKRETRRRATKKRNCPGTSAGVPKYEKRFHTENTEDHRKPPRKNMALRAKRVWLFSVALGAFSVFSV